MNHADEERALHRRAWEAIPWLVNGRIGEAERNLLEAHLRMCRDCSEEFASQQRLRDGVLRQPGPAPDPEAALARLWQRIDAEAAMRPGGRAAPWTRWLAAAVVVQAIALAALLGARFAPAAPTYRTLSTATAASPPHAIRAVFSGDLPIAELGHLLDRAGLTIVDGPNEVGVYTLAPRADSPRDAALALLRADGRVRFAEPVADSPR